MIFKDKLEPCDTAYTGYFNNQQGFTKQSDINQVKSLTISADYDEYKDIPMEYIKAELAHEIANSILKNNLLVFSSYKNHYNLSTTITATINVAEPGPKYVNLLHNKFIVNGVNFTNEQLVEAVENYYAEYLI